MYSEEDNANVNGQVKASSVFFKRAKFAASGWLLGSPGMLYRRRIMSLHAITDRVLYI